MSRNEATAFRDDPFLDTLTPEDVSRLNYRDFLPDRDLTMRDVGGTDVYDDAAHRARRDRFFSSLPDRIDAGVGDVPPAPLRIVMRRFVGSGLLLLGLLALAALWKW